MSGLLLGLALLGSLLTLALFLSGDSAVALTARVVLIGVACAALVAEAWLGARDESELHFGVELAGSLGAVSAAVIARVVGDARTNEAVLLSAVIVAGTAANLFLLRRARRPLDLDRERLSAALDRDCVRVVGEDVAPARALDLRPGEEVLVAANELVPADATVTAGSATVLPWLGAKSTQLAREGDVVVAGARVVEGHLARRGRLGGTTAPGRGSRWIRAGAPISRPACPLRPALGGARGSHRGHARGARQRSRPTATSSRCS